jgi:hypothetical protein
MSKGSKRAVEYTRQLAAEQRKRREQHEASVRKLIAPYDGTKKLIAKVRKGEAVTTNEVLRELALAKHASMDKDKRTEALIPIPVELLDVIATKLTPIAKVARKASARKGERRKLELHRQWQAKADELFRKNRHLTKHDAGKLIARAMGGDPDWIRRKIVKPK